MGLIILSIIIYVGSFYVSKRKDFFQPEAFLNLYFIVLIGIGPIALFFFSQEMFDSQHYQEVIVIVLLGYVSINIGYYLASGVKFKALHTAKNKLDHRISEKLSKKNFKATSYIFIVLGLICAFIFYIRAGGVPMLQKNKEVARTAALAVGGNGYFLYLMTTAMYGVALFAIYTFHYKTNNLKLFLIFGIVAIVMTGTGSRRYLLWLCLYILISRHYIIKALATKVMVFFSFLGLLFVNLFEMYRNPNSATTTDLGTAFMFRFVLYISNLEKVISAFISKNTFEYGTTFYMDIITALPGKQLDYQSWLKQVTHLEFEGFGIPPTLMGDLYVNFGYPGIIIGCVIFGFGIRKLYNNLIVKGKSLSNIFLYIVSLEIASKIITSGISSQSVSIVWLWIFLFMYKSVNTILTPSSAYVYSY